MSTQHWQAWCRLCHRYTLHVGTADTSHHAVCGVLLLACVLSTCVIGAFAIAAAVLILLVWLAVTLIHSSHVSAWHCSQCGTAFVEASAQADYRRCAPPAVLTEKDVIKSPDSTPLESWFDEAQSRAAD